MENGPPEGQELVDRVDRVAGTLAVREGLESIERGEGKPARAAIEGIRQRTRRSSPAAP
jgi:hypothetical protein